MYTGGLNQIAAQLNPEPLPAPIANLDAITRVLADIETAQFLRMLAGIPFAVSIMKGIAKPNFATLSIATGVIAAVYISNKHAELMRLQGKQL